MAGRAGGGLHSDTSAHRHVPAARRQSLAEAGRLGQSRSSMVRKSQESSAAALWAASCSLQTHRFGWEVVLEVNGLLSRSQVCRSRDEVLDLCDQWRAVMVDSGWDWRE